MIAALRAVAAVAALLCGATLWTSAQVTRKVTIDDLMALRTINDVKISPSGDRVAYVVSTPSVARNAHEPALFVLPSTGGSATRLAPETRIFTPALPAPRLRWSPDGTTLSILALVEGRPQVMAVASTGGFTRAITAAPAGVSGYEWSPDGKSVAFLSRDAAPPPPVATRAGALPPATRLWVQSLDPAAPARPLTSPTEYVDSFSWSPSGTELAYAFAPTVGFLAPYSTRIVAVPVSGGMPRPIVDRGGMNVSPQFSPDGRHIAFVTTNGRTDIIAPRGLAVVAAAAPTAGGPASPIRSFPMDGAWIAETVWARDSQSLFVTMNEGTFTTGGADVRDARGPRGARRRTPAATRRRRHRGLLAQSQPRRTDPRLPRGPRADHGRCRRARCVDGPAPHDHRRQPGAGRPRAWHARADQLDPRVPIATAQKFYRALRALGKTVEFDTYPRGGHVFDEPAQERTVMRRNLEWFQAWIRSPG